MVGMTRHVYVINGNRQVCQDCGKRPDDPVHYGYQNAHNHWNLHEPSWWETNRGYFKLFVILIVGGMMWYGIILVVSILLGVLRGN